MAKPEREHQPGSRRPAPAQHQGRRPRPPAAASQRLRIPQPVIRQRIPSGRGATEQPNATGDGEAALTARLWITVVLAGAAAGLFGDALMWLLFSVEHLAFNYHSGSFEAAVAHASGLRRVLSLTIAGAFGGAAWYGIRRYLNGERTDVDDAVWNGGRLGFRRSLLNAAVSEVVVGMGASLGREAAPKAMGGAAGSVLSTWAGLSPAQRRLVIACGGGAGLAAVYNVPLAGALFSAEILCGGLALPTVLPAAACSWIATATAWLYLPDRATYPSIPNFSFTTSLMVWALISAPLIGLAAAGYIRLIAWVSHHQARGLPLLIALPLALTALGLLGISYPQLFGNGKDMAHAAFLGGGALTLLLALSILKPLATALCLGAGGSGGLFTPTLSTGAVFGGLLGGVWSLLWPGTPAGAYALVGAAAMIGASLQAPLTALALMVELTHGGFQLMVPMMAAVVIATATARYIDGYSIYTARLRAR